MRTSLIAGAAFAATVSLAAAMAPAAIVLTSENRSVTAVNNVPGSPEIENQQSDATTNTNVLEAGDGYNDYGVVESTYTELDSGFNGTEFVNTYFTGRSLVTTNSSADYSNQDDYTETRIDLYYNVTDTNNQYTWHYNGPVTLTGSNGTSGLTLVMSGSNGVYSYNSYSYPFSTTDINLSGTLPQATGSYHLVLEADTGGDLDSTPSSSASGSYTLTGDTFSITSVPEPSTLMGAMGALLLWRRRSRG